MPFVAIGDLAVFERLPGWRGRYFHTLHVTVAHYEFAAGATVPAHRHPQEEIYELLEGELEIAIDDAAQVVRPGTAVIVPPNAQHSLKALTSGRMIVIDSPSRMEMATPSPAPPA